MSIINSENDVNDGSFGFIILRCVKKKEHNLLFKECYECIRKLYNNKILIIDDQSDKIILEEYEFENTIVIDSEHPQCGEILPYYYFYKLKPFDKAIILHDSMFIKDKININQITDIKFFWHFIDHKWDEIEIEIKFIGELNYVNGLIERYVNRTWFGCFGASCVISYDFVKLLNDKYNLFKLLPLIKQRKDRMAFERIIGLIPFFENKVSSNNCSFNGIIHNFPLAFNFTYDLYKKTSNGLNIENHKLIKVWCKR